jgi:hypothetical protein
MNDLEPKLGPPGAGLPKVELALAKLLFALRRWTGDREAFNKRFELERRSIEGQIRSCKAESGACRVLIERPRGLEDSSRYWSVWMTLDHLRIVNSQVGKIIKTLARGETPPGEASTARVKPSKMVTASVVAEYESSCDELLKTVAGVENLNTRVRYSHPWFGPMDAFGWHALSAGHMGIHRVQIERILNGLPRPANSASHQA